MTGTIRLLIVGTGGMAKNHAEGFSAIPGVQVVAGVDTRPAQLAAFQEAHGIPHGFPSVEAALNWGGFDAVTNVTPDAAHYATTLPFLAAGKHVLCEKPLATNEAHAAEMAETAAKAGVVGLVRGLAVELARDGIRVNGIAPGYIRTAQLLSKENSLGPEGAEKAGEFIPMGRIGEPEDIADVALFLASNAARYMTGQVVVVDGGLLVGRY